MSHTFSLFFLFVCVRPVLEENTRVFSVSVCGVDLYSPRVPRGFVGLA